METNEKYEGYLMFTPYAESDCALGALNFCPYGPGSMIDDWNHLYETLLHPADYEDRMAKAMMKALKEADITEGNHYMWDQKGEQAFDAKSWVVLQVGTQKDSMEDVERAMRRVKDLPLMRQTADELER